MYFLYCRTIIFFIFFLFPVLYPLSSILAALSPADVYVSTSGPENAPKSVLPRSLNSPGAFEGVFPPSGLGKYAWQADVIFFSDSFNGFPALAVSCQEGRNGFILLYSNSILPDIRNKGAFLRSAGVAVKSVTTNVLIDGISTATYTTDLVDEFSTRTRFLELFYYRLLYKNEFMRAGLLLGLPFAWHTYAIAGALEDGGRFGETGRAFGLGLAPGLTASFSSASMLDKGFEGSLFLIYHKLWFKGMGGPVAKDLRERLDDFRFGFSLGWRFNFYR